MRTERERRRKTNGKKTSKYLKISQKRIHNHSYIKSVINGFCVSERQRARARFFFPYFSVWASHCLGPREAHSLSSLSMMNDQVCVQLCECVCFSAFLVNMYAKLRHKIWLCCFSVLFSISISWWLFFSLFLSFSIYQSDGMKSEQKLMQIMLLMYQALLLQSVLY